jgi:hypothetical protein
MERPAAEIARRLAGNAEAVCRRYLSQGRREGRYWLVGDARNTPGRSLYVRLVATPDGRGLAGKWTDSATGEHGDLLDIIALAGNHRSLRDTLDEARRFLRLPQPDPAALPVRQPRSTRAPSGSPDAARRLLAATRPVHDTLAARYLRGRHLASLHGCDALRFHPRCYYWPNRDDLPGTRTAWPALIAVVTDLADQVTGVHRTWLDPATRDKAPIASPRRAMGHLLGHGVRFGRADDVMTAGEGIETMLSLRQVVGQLPLVAGLSSAHLAAVAFPPSLRRLYVARDADPSGDAAVATLAERATAANIDLVPLSPVLDDFNDDLCILGRAQLKRSIMAQLKPEDWNRFASLPG